SAGARDPTPGGSALPAALPAASTAWVTAGPAGAGTCSVTGVTTATILSTGRGWGWGWGVGGCVDGVPAGAGRDAAGAGAWPPPTASRSTAPSRAHGTIRAALEAP